MDGFLRVADGDMVGGLTHEPVDNSSDNCSFLGLRLFWSTQIGHF
jgi:hypothetical protein